VDTHKPARPAIGKERPGAAPARARLGRARRLHADRGRPRAHPGRVRNRPEPARRQVAAARSRRSARCGLPRLAACWRLEPRRGGAARSTPSPAPPAGAATAPRTPARRRRRLDSLEGGCPDRRDRPVPSRAANRISRRIPPSVCASSTRLGTLTCRPRELGLCSRSASLPPPRLRKSRGSAPPACPAGCWTAPAASRGFCTHTSPLEPVRSRKEDAHGSARNRSRAVGAPRAMSRCADRLERSSDPREAPSGRCGPARTWGLPLRFVLPVDLETR